MNVLYASVSRGSLPIVEYTTVPNQDRMRIMQLLDELTLKNSKIISQSDTMVYIVKMGEDRLTYAIICDDTYNEEFSELFLNKIIQFCVDKNASRLSPSSSRELKEEFVKKFQKLSRKFKNKKYLKKISKPKEAAVVKNSIFVKEEKQPLLNDKNMQYTDIIQFEREKRGNCCKRFWWLFLIITILVLGAAVFSSYCFWLGKGNCTFLN